MRTEHQHLEEEVEDEFSLSLVMMDPAWVYSRYCQLWLYRSKAKPILEERNIARKLLLSATKTSKSTE